ncbi:MAG TPA: hypothetical protein VHR16_07515 [Candidatus Limnocylindrales bacterium]|nr:hypothetical protein [Candidatus Limnocylindrales bacterium]
MTEVYVDVGAASIEAAAHDGGLPPVDPEAVRALRHLAEAGFRVFVITASGAEPAADLREVATAVLDAVPSRPGDDDQAWYLTSDIERCVGSSAHLRTVLIGGTPPGGSVRRCDAVARHVQAAAMEILAAEAMPARAE